MTPTEKADQLIALMQSWGLSPDEMLEIIANVRKRLEAIKQEEDLNKPCKQFKMFE